MEEQKLVELKPCPFCGSDAAFAVFKDLGVCVRCTNIECRAQTAIKYDNFGLLGDWPEKPAVEEVAKRWNRR